MFIYKKYNGYTFTNQPDPFGLIDSYMYKGIPANIPLSLLTEISGVKEGCECIFIESYPVHDDKGREKVVKRNVSSIWSGGSFYYERLVKHKNSESFFTEKTWIKNPAFLKALHVDEKLSLNSKILQTMWSMTNENIYIYKL